MRGSTVWRLCPGSFAYSNAFVSPLGPIFSFDPSFSKWFHPSEFLRSSGNCQLLWSPYSSSTPPSPSHTPQSFNTTSSHRMGSGSSLLQNLSVLSKCNALNHSEALHRSSNISSWSISLSKKCFPMHQQLHFFSSLAASVAAAGGGMRGRRSSKSRSKKQSLTESKGLGVGRMKTVAGRRINFSQDFQRGSRNQDDDNGNDDPFTGLSSMSDKLNSLSSLSAHGKKKRDYDNRLKGFLRIEHRKLEKQKESQREAARKTRYGQIDTIAKRSSRDRGKYERNYLRDENDDENANEEDDHYRRSRKGSAKRSKKDRRSDSRSSKSRNHNGQDFGYENAEQERYNSHHHQSGMKDRRKYKGRSLNSSERESQRDDLALDKEKLTKLLDEINRQKIEGKTVSNPLLGSGAAAFLKKQVRKILPSLSQSLELKQQALIQGITIKEFETGHEAFSRHVLQEFMIYEPIAILLAEDGFGSFPDEEKLKRLGSLFINFILQQRQREQDVRSFSEIVNLRQPHEMFSFARSLKRKFVFHAGPTNSGKTYQALNRFKGSASGLYCGPLRLLALEIFEDANACGVKCDLLTGEEQRRGTGKPITADSYQEYDDDFEVLPSRMVIDAVLCSPVQAKKSSGTSSNSASEVQSSESLPFREQDFANRINEQRSGEEHTTTQKAGRKLTRKSFRLSLKRKVKNASSSNNHSEETNSTNHFSNQKDASSSSSSTLPSMISKSELSFAGGVSDKDDGKRSEISGHLSSTVEMAPLNRYFDVAVVDEIQMIGDASRGWAWTRAILGLAAKEIHLCGEDRAIGIVSRLLQEMGEEVEINSYERLSPLSAECDSLHGNLAKLQSGDALIAFSRKDIYRLKERIESSTSNKCAVVYGSLPPKTRSEQARSFNNPDSEFNILVASDAIGMGLNLNIGRIIFSSIVKFDGESVRNLQVSEVKQISGRAGRFKSIYPNGKVFSLFSEDASYITNTMNLPLQPIDKAGLKPSYEHIEKFMSRLPGLPLATAVDYVVTLAQMDDKYFMCELSDFKAIAIKLEEMVNLSLMERYIFCSAPINRDPYIMHCLVSFASSFSRGLVVPLDEIEIPDEIPQHPEILLQYEKCHAMLDLYLWLSYQFPSTFPERKHARLLQRQVQERIKEGLLAQSKANTPPSVVMSRRHSRRH